MQFVRTVVVCLAAVCAGQAAVSQLSCAGTAAQAVIRAEGAAERVGDIVLTCQSNLPNGDVISAVQVVFSVPVAESPAAQLTFERGETVVQTLTGEVTGNNIVSFPPISATVGAAGEATIRISNIRVNATGRAGQSVTAFIGTTGTTGLGVVPNPVTPAIIQPGLLVNSTTTNILCVGSPVPLEDPLTVANLFSGGTAFSTLRATEGSADAFQVKLGGATTGTRILVRLSGFPAGARVFLPTVITGSSATQPTSGGDLGLPRSPGRYTPGPTGSLLLAMVAGANSNGGGGVTLYQPGPTGSGTVLFLEAREVTLASGSGQAVYEVVDSNSTVFESAQIPVFVSLPSGSSGNGTVAEASLKLGPTTSTDIPRFSATQTPGLDCTVLHDCDANYFPHLEVDAPVLDFAAPLGSQVPLSKRIIVSNSRGGLMPWRVSWVYQDGTGWLNVVSKTGVNQAAFQLDANVAAITAPGLYRATLMIDAGALAGTVQLPVTLTVGGDANAPLVSAATNGADTGLTRLVPGSRAILAGVRFPAQPTVEFNGIAARVLAATAERIEVIVPETLGAVTSAAIVVRSGAQASAGFNAVIAPSAPAIYPGAIFNQDNTRNASNAPEQAGRILQVFLTGLPTDGRVTVRLEGDSQPVTVSDVPYAGPAPFNAGVQQVNLRIPAQLPAGGPRLVICGAGNATAEGCTASVLLYVTR